MQSDFFTGQVDKGLIYWPNHSGENSTVHSIIKIRSSKGQSVKQRDWWLLLAAEIYLHLVFYLTLALLSIFVNTVAWRSLVEADEVASFGLV